MRFHQVHLEDLGRVRVRKYCELEDREVTQGEIGKGYEVSKDQVVTITDDELAEMPLPTAKAVEIAAFVPYESIDPLRIGQGYYLEADGPVAAKPYVLLRKALERSSKAAVAKFAWHGRERLGLLRIRDDAIVLHAMRWDDEIRDPSELAPKPVDLTDDEITEAQLLIDRMTRDDLEGPEFADHYTDALEKAIEAKREGKEPPQASQAPEPKAQVVDLMAALEASVAKAQASRGEASHAEVHEMPKKKTAARKTTKTPAKKTTKKAAKPGRSA
ncbi:Ku protein [Streptomyces sp. NBC_00268]|uniref:non-homologous end joining protein Ku n=1 Tax=Streptomyces sp. NBC_00268 TaxID=2975695 RepID=UPI002256A554|nr:Ku protein [Streptomyces sp. NBC_00268]MCX5181233.1 Ku protein [Streptomyces sp. NBC_00268]